MLCFSEPFLSIYNHTMHTTVYLNVKKNMACGSLRNSYHRDIFSPSARTPTLQFCVFGFSKAPDSTYQLIKKPCVCWIRCWSRENKQDTVQGFLWSKSENRCSKMCSTPISENRKWYHGTKLNIVMTLDK